MKTTEARDGSIAYTLPNWTREKLFYIERYIDIFCTAMRNKKTLVYADFLAGPGLCVDTETREEQPGSALLAVRRPEFSRLFINDINPRVTDVLNARIASEPEDRILIETLDCNVAVDAARDFLFPIESRRKTLGIAVIDPPGYQMTSDSIRRLTDGVRLDLLIVFMTGPAHRFLELPAFDTPLGSIIGQTELEKLRWRRRVGARLTFGDLLDSFEAQLNSMGYSHVCTSPRTENSRRAAMYHVVYASKHPLGREFFEKIAQRRWNGQRRLALPI